MQQTKLQQILVTSSMLLTVFLTCCYSSVDSQEGQEQSEDFQLKEHIVGKKNEASDGKHPWKTIGAPNVTSLKDPTLPVAVAIEGKQRVQPDVEAAVLEMATQSTHPVRVTIDSGLGTLRRFSGRLKNPHGQSTAGAVQFLKENLPGYGLKTDVPLTLDVSREVVDEDGARHVVVTPTVGDLPVWMAAAAIHLDAGGNVRSINAENLSDVTPKGAVRFDADAAIDAAARALLPLSNDGNVENTVAPQLGIMPALKGKGTSAYTWRLVQMAREADGTPQYYETYVNAQSGELAARYATTVSAALTSATGSVVNTLGATESLRVSYSQDYGMYVLLDQSRGLAATQIMTYNANNAYDLTMDNSTLVASANANQWDQIGGSTHANVQKTMDYYLNTHGRNSWDGQGAPARVVVHFGQQYNNAYWSPYEQRTVFGDADGIQFKSFGGALDVVAHEWSHAVVSATANLIYENQSGALNESFADVMSVMVDRDDWIQGEDIMLPAGSAIRSLADPSLYGHPGHMDDYRDISWNYGGVHINCGIPSHAAYLVAVDPRASREVTEKVWYRTLNQGHVGRYANFKDMAEGSLVACNELVQKASLTQQNCDAVVSAWVGVGVLTEVPASGCPLNSTEKNGLCYCNSGYAPSMTSDECILEDSLTCPANSVATNGQCFCLDGFRVPPSDDTSAPMTCEPEETACPKNSSWDAAKQECVCDEGFEGNPDGLDGGCTVILSDCPQNSHPVWNGEPSADTDMYQCDCNSGFEYDAVSQSCAVIPGGCGNESFYGRCVGDSLIYCGPDGIETVACGDSSLVCGLFDSRIGYDCLNPSGVAAAGVCAADGYQECDANNPFCVAETNATQGFCSLECKVNDDCGATFACCGSVSDGTRACLTSAYCDDVVNIKATCNDVMGGSAYYGACDGNVLVYCDGSTLTTQSVNCPKLGQVCRFVDEEVGYNCVNDGSAAAIAAPADWCPYEGDGVCDAPGVCPAGSDLLDCHPCGTVTANGQCTDAVLNICDATMGLVTTDCATLPETPVCTVDTAGTAACTAEPDTDTDSDTATQPTESKKSDSCSCQTVGSRNGALFSLLNFLLSLF
ncbi:MAG: M4 family metallopeptidase [Deltaproteobacteria bacterium]|nr:M4 family metallopeptidase [Deltaproteobacteria bacterium]